MKPKFPSDQPDPEVPPWRSSELVLLNRLGTPQNIQDFLDSIPYNPSDTCRSPRGVMQARRAHCLEGALLACAALIHHGRSAGLLNLGAELGLGHDHVVATFRDGRCLGAVGKSNYATLRYRSPVYRSLRELTMSYFDFYHNVVGDLVIRSYSHSRAPAERAFPGWRVRNDDLFDISRSLDRARQLPVIDRRQARCLRVADQRLVAASLLGADRSGLFAPLASRSPRR